MLFAEDRSDAEFKIQSCDTQGIVINGRSFTENFMLLPGLPIQPWPLDFEGSLQPRHFSEILERKPELVILGTGTTLRLPGPEVYGSLLSQRIGLEAMTTAAACRTYNLLAQDGRDIAACLILPA